MLSLKELCLVKCFEIVSKRSCRLYLRNLPKDLRHELIFRLFVSSPPVLDYFRVVNLIPLDFMWCECQHNLASYRFTYGLFYSYNTFKSMMIIYGINYENSQYVANFEKICKDQLDNVLSCRLSYTIKFFQRANHIKFNGHELGIRQDAGPVEHNVNEIMPFWQTSTLERGLRSFQKGLYPIQFGGRLCIMYITLSLIDYDFRDISIELRPDPKITRGIDALILDKISKPSLHPIW